MDDSRFPCVSWFGYAVLLISAWSSKLAGVIVSLHCCCVVVSWMSILLMLCDCYNVGTSYFRWAWIWDDCCQAHSHWCTRGRQVRFSLAAAYPRFKPSTGKKFPDVNITTMQVWQCNCGRKHRERMEGSHLPQNTRCFWVRNLKHFSLLNCGNSFVFLFTLLHIMPD